MKKIIILLSSLVLVAAYLVVYLFDKGQGQLHSTNFSSLTTTLLPQMDVRDFLRDNPDATQFSIDAGTEINIESPSLGLNKKFSNPYFRNCHYTFLEGKLNSFFCVSDLNEKNLDQQKYFLEAIKSWGKPDLWKTVNVGNTFGPAMIWEDERSLKVVRGVFDDYNPKMFAVSVSYREGRKLEDLVKLPESPSNYRKKLVQIKYSLLNQLNEGD